LIVLKSKLFQNLSANTLQLVINQLAGLVIFYLLSTGLDKNSFGQLNLALAILMMAFNLLSLGIDQVSIRKIASGGDAGEVLSLYLFHVLLTGFLFYGAILLGSLFISQTNGVYPLLLLLGAGKLMIYFSTPFKQAASGLERFKMLGSMLVISNLIRSVALLVLAIIHVISLQNAVIIFVVGDVLELLTTGVIFSRGTKISFNIMWHQAKYTALLREALPQTGVNILTSAMARFDWVFIGFMASAVKLAEYSFAYKVFEMSTLPLLAIAPLLIPKFTKIFKQGAVDTAGLQNLVRAEMAIAAFTGLALNILWSPVIDAITGGKYGAVNAGTVFILSLCIPFLYLNNFLWTIFFAKGEMKLILKGFIITFLVNAGLDVVLIPYFGNEGAAIGFLASYLVQAVFYLSHNRIKQLNTIWQNLALCTGCALASGFVMKLCVFNCWLSLLLGTFLYIALLYLSKQLRLSDRKTAAAAFSG
jgi:O-antigen/teichoic acid export membrane protein